MSDHSVGAIEFIRTLLPDALEPVFAGITILGDPWFLIVVVLLFYWFGNRDGALRVMGLALGASGIVLFLKATFALGRPTVGPPIDPTLVPTLFRPIYAGEVHADGYAFPSGHALASTVTWGGLALVVERGRRRTRLGLTAVLVALIALSRVVLGVHFLADVVAGVAIGVAFLAGATVAVERIDVDATTALIAVGLVLGVAALAVTGLGEDSQVVVGTAIAGLTATRLSIPETPWPASPTGAAYAAVGLVGFGAVGGAGIALDIPGNVLVTMAIAVSAVLVWPVGTAAIERWRRDDGAGTAQ